MKKYTKDIYDNKKIVVKENHYPLSDRGYGNRYSHVITLSKIPKEHVWKIEYGCEQDGWAIHGAYGYYQHGKKVIRIIPEDMAKYQLMSAEELFAVLTKRAKADKIKVCW